MKILITVTFFLPIVVAQGIELVLDKVPVDFQAGTTLVDTFRVDIHHSSIKWKGTKFWGLGKHEGIIQITSGELYINEGFIKGGWFDVDMHSIEVTDIPKSDPIPRKRLRDHLLHEDFFAVSIYPISHFVITEVKKEKNGSHLITGNLTLRGRTRPITFTAEVPVFSNRVIEAAAKFSINRRHWGISFNGSRLTNDLVDDNIHLEILLNCNGIE